MKAKRNLTRALPKLQMAELVLVIIVFVIASLAAMLGLSVQRNIANTMATCPTNYSFSTTNQSCLENNLSQPGTNSVHPTNLEYNASENAQQGISNLTAQFPNIGLVVGAVIIISLLVAGFAFAFRGGGNF